MRNDHVYRNARLFLGCIHSIVTLQGLRCTEEDCLKYRRKGLPAG